MEPSKHEASGLQRPSLNVTVGQFVNYHRADISSVYCKMKMYYEPNPNIYFFLNLSFITIETFIRIKTQGLSQATYDLCIRELTCHYHSFLVLQIVVLAKPAEFLKSLQKPNSGLLGFQQPVYTTKTHKRQSLDSIIQDGKALLGCIANKMLPSISCYVHLV